MHILFVDESGTPPHPDKTDPPYFVVGGLSIPESVWPEIRDLVLGLKTRRKIRGEFKWRYFAPGNEDKRNPMRKLDASARDEIREELCGIVSRFNSVKSIVAVCSPPAAYSMHSVRAQNDIYQLTYKTLTERFQYYLQDISKELGRKEYGLIIADHRDKSDDRSLRAHHQMLINSSADHTSKYENLIENVLLQQSHHSLGIQLADLVAGAVWRKFQRQDERWYDLIEPSIRRSKSGTVDGYGIVRVPKTGWR